MMCQSLVPIWASFTDNAEKLNVILQLCIFCYQVRLTMLVKVVNLYNTEHVQSYDFNEKKKKKKEITPPSPTFRAEAGTPVRVTADITAAS